MNEYTQNKNKERQAFVSNRIMEIVAALIKNGFSKSGIAEKIGSYNHCILDVVKGRRSLTMGQVKALVDAFEVNPAYIFLDNQTMFISDRILVHFEVPIEKRILDKRENL